MFTTDQGQNWNRVGLHFKDMNQFYISLSNNPYFNLAFERYLFSQIKPEDKILYLWRNSKTVVIGRFQNPWTECNVEKMNSDSVKLMRRYSGGGAVFQDLGNLCFTLISGSSYDIDEQKKINVDFIISALGEFGIRAYGSGRNDILVDGKKISGSAFQIHSGSLMHHGTLLVNSDLDKLHLYLNPSKDKLEAKGIKSIRSRVANLHEFNSSISVESLINSLKKTYVNKYGDFNLMREINEDSLSGNLALKNDYEQLISWDWLYGKTPDFTDCIKNRFVWGEIQILFNVHQGVIKDVSVFSDTLNNFLVEKLIGTLQGKQFSNEAIYRAIITTAETTTNIETKNLLIDVAALFQ